MPVFGTIAARFNDDGVTALYQALAAKLAGKGLKLRPGKLPPVATRQSTAQHVIMPPARVRYLAEIAETVRHYHQWAGGADADRARAAAAAAAKAMLAADARPARNRALKRAQGRWIPAFEAMTIRRARRLDRRPRCEARPARQKASRHVAEDQGRVLGRRVRREDPRQGDPHRADHDDRCRARKIRKVALPQFEDDGEILRWQLKENVPGSFPFTAGVFAFKRENEDPTRMFAGEGDAFRTNRRFHLLADGMPAKRLSTAFDSVTLYGNDPDRPARHLWQGRQFRRVDRDARRHEGALLAASTSAIRPRRCR